MGGCAIINLLEILRKMNTNLNTVHHRQQVIKNNNSLLDLLAVLVIGGIGMTISFSAGDDALAYALGLIIMILVIIRLSFDCLNAYCDYKDRSKYKTKNQ